MNINYFRQLFECINITERYIRGRRSRPIFGYFRPAPTPPAPPPGHSSPRAAPPTTPPLAGGANGRAARLFRGRHERARGPGDGKAEPGGGTPAAERGATGWAGRRGGCPPGAARGASARGGFCSGRRSFFPVQESKKPKPIRMRAVSARVSFWFGFGANGRCFSVRSWVWFGFVLVVVSVSGPCVYLVYACLQNGPKT